MVLFREVVMVLNMATLSSSLCMNVSIGLNTIFPSDVTEKMHAYCSYFRPQGND